MTYGDGTLTGYVDGVVGSSVTLSRVYSKFAVIYVIGDWGLEQILARLQTVTCQAIVYSPDGINWSSTDASAKTSTLAGVH